MSNGHAKHDLFVFRLPNVLIEEKLFCARMCRGFADEWSSGGGGGGGVGCGTGKAMSSAAASKQGLQYAVTTEAQLAAEHILREHKLYSPESRSKR